MVAHFLHDLGMFGRHVVGLARIGGDVVQLAVADESPFVEQNRRVPFGRPGRRDPTVLNDQHALGKRGLSAAKQTCQAGAVEMGAVGNLQAAQLGQGGQHVLHAGQLANIAARCPARRRASE